MITRADAPPEGLASIGPDAERTRWVDANLRARLSDSFAYLGSVLERSVGERLTGLCPAILARPVSPWVFCLYSHLVARIAADAGGESDIVSNIETAVLEPAAAGPVALDDGATPEAWWEHYHALLDTDPARRFVPIAPSRGDFDAAAGALVSALDLLARSDPPLHQEVTLLIRLPVLGMPPTSDDDHRFNGASTFFFWGGALFNAALRREAIATVDLLVHEASHLLLFGIVEGRALTLNDPSERYSSPLRPDPRPIDGIFHACFVSARVEEAMRRLLASGGLSAGETAAAERHLERAAVAARSGLQSLDQHAEPTPRGRAILDALRVQLTGAAAVRP